MNGVQIRFYDLLRNDLHLPDDKAAAFVEVLGEVVEFEVKNEKQAVATKEDIHQLNVKIDTTASSVRDDIHNLQLKLEQSKVDLYKAMFWTGIVQLLAILGGVLAIVKFASS